MKLVNTLDCGSSIRGFESLQPPVKIENRIQCGFLFYLAALSGGIVTRFLYKQPSLIVIFHKAFLNTLERIVMAVIVLYNYLIRRFICLKRAEPGKENSDKCLLFIIPIIASVAEYV